MSVLDKLRALQNLESRIKEAEEVLGELDDDVAEADEKEGTEEQKEAWIKKAEDAFSEQEGHIDELCEVRDQLRDQVMDTQEYELVEWIKHWGGDCNAVRQKINSEGVGYFYNSYTTVPAEWNTYTDFVDDVECWCGACS